MIGRSPVQDAKAVKNDVEKEGMRQCHLRDGTALIEYFAWLENELKSGKKLDEVEAADKLEQIRRCSLFIHADGSTQDLFVGLSFDTISATGPNGAIIHYKPEKETCATIDPKEIYLCDSGAQYKYLSPFQAQVGTAQPIQPAQSRLAIQRQNNRAPTPSF
jgi:Xaa-Pro aminopeptidase